MSSIMENFFEEFETRSKSNWEAQLLKDLKGASLEELKFSDEIEGFSFTSYQHQEDKPDTYVDVIPSNNNTWYNVVRITVDDESSANKKALDALMTGADGLLLVNEDSQVKNWKTVIDKIETEVIHISFKSNCLNDFKELYELGLSNFHFCYDEAANPLSDADFQHISGILKEKQRPFFDIDCFSIQQIGANCSQQLAFALLNGHHLLIKLMRSGLTIDEASACIHFNIGVGSHYFIETAKINALKKMWRKIILAYEPLHNCSTNCQLHATIGLMNKSIMDPYTNLLRQTTESLSALNSGVQSICVLPYDSESTNPTELAERMAKNIPLILKEECYIDKVSSPLNGSYSLINLESTLTNLAWGIFVDSEEKGGWESKGIQLDLLDKINETKTKRIQRLSVGKDILIGVNKYLNPEQISNDWLTPKTYLGSSLLRLELELNTVAG